MAADDGSPIAGMGPGTLFSEYNQGNGHRQKPKALAVIVDRVNDEDGDGATNIEDVKLFLKRNKASRRALKADHLGGYLGGKFLPLGDFSDRMCIMLLIVTQDD